MRQYPIVPAYALTVHKAQGLTLDVVNIDGSHVNFVPGHVYVALSRARFAGRGAALQGILMTQMFPATMLLLPLYLLMRKLHLVDTLGGVMIAYVATALPFCVWTMKGYYDTIPVDLNEAYRTLNLMDPAVRNSDSPNRCSA